MTDNNLKLESDTAPTENELPCQDEESTSSSVNNEVDQNDNLEPNPSNSLDEPPIERSQGGLRVGSPDGSGIANQVLKSSLANQSVQPAPSVEQQLLKAKRDLESMVLKYAKSESDNLQNKYKAEELDKKLKRAIKDNDQLANRIKLLTNDKNHLSDTLNAKIAQLTVLEQKSSVLNNVQISELKEYEEKIKRLENREDELLKQIESYKSKEGELLDFSERLSMKHMILQTELDEALKKVPSFKEQYEFTLVERDDYARQVREQAKRIDVLREELEQERANCEVLRMELSQREAKFRNLLDESQNEIKVLRRKHQIAMKELMKELRLLQCRERAKGENNVENDLSA